MQEWTIGQLIEELQKHPADTKVQLEDADTNWAIPKFTIDYLSEDKVLWFMPCSYEDMI